MTKHRSIPLILLAAATGAAVAFMGDPLSGARRRALLRDKLVHYRIAIPRRLARRAHGIAGQAEGLAHNVVERTPWQTPRPLPDESIFLAQAVETELGREAGLPLGAINFDAADGIVHVRGTVASDEIAKRIVQRAAKVEGVRAVISLMRTPDGEHVGGSAGDQAAITAGPRALLQGEAVRRALLQRWPSLTDNDILASEGHLEALEQRICAHTSQPEQEVRTAIEEILLRPTE